MLHHGGLVLSKGAIDYDEPVAPGDVALLASMTRSINQVYEL